MGISNTYFDGAVLVAVVADSPKIGARTNFGICTQIGVYSGTEPKKTLPNTQIWRARVAISRHSAKQRRLEKSCVSYINKIECENRSSSGL